MKGKKVNKITAFIKKLGIGLKRKAPTILVIAGTAGTVRTVVLACKETIDIQEDITAAMADVNEVKKTQGEVSEESYRMRLANSYRNIGRTFIFHYYPSVLLGAASITCILSSHYILTKRLAGRLTAYGVLYKDFMEYRKKVKEDLGEEVDKNYIRQIQENKETLKHTPYSRIFDENSPYFEKHNHQFNLEYLYYAQSYFNDLLNTVGWVRLNDVLKFIGVPTIDGPFADVIGWQRGMVVDFGLSDISKKSVRDFINGHEEAIWLDFNCDDISSWLSLLSH